jgi:hypothetical protein
VKWKVNLGGVIPANKENTKVKYSLSRQDNQGHRKKEMKESMTRITKIAETNQPLRHPDRHIPRGDPAVGMGPSPSILAS